MQESINRLIVSDKQKKLTIVIQISRLFRVPEAAEFLNMEESFLHELMAKGELSFRKVCSEVVISEIDLWDWMYKQNPIMIKNENPTFDIFAN